MQGKLPKLHKLKCETKYFHAVAAGEKTFEVRFNDREFDVNDFLQLEDFHPETQELSGLTVAVKVTYMCDYMQRKGYVVLAIALVHGPLPDQWRD